MINWLYSAASFVLFLIGTTIGWGNAAPSVKAIVLALVMSAAIGLRLWLGPRLSFQFLLLARAMIWMTVFIALSAIMITAFRLNLPPAGIAGALFLGVFGIFAVSLMMMLAIGKPCPACDERSPIQILKGPALVGGNGGLDLRFWQSGIADRCPICDADWSFTETELRAARLKKAEDQATP